MCCSCGFAIVRRSKRAWFSENDPHFDPHVIALEALLRVKLRKPLYLRCEIYTADRARVRYHGPHPSRVAFEAAQRRAGAAVAADLLVVKGVRADSNEAPE